MASPNSKSLRHLLLLHDSRLCPLSSRCLFALAACGRLAGIRTQVDMSRLAESIAKLSERNTRDHAASGLSEATQDFEKAAHDLVRPCCLQAALSVALRSKVHRSIAHHASSPVDRSNDHKDRIEKSQRRVAEKFATGCCWRKSAGICMLFFAADR